MGSILKYLRNHYWLVLIVVFVMQYSITILVFLKGSNNSEESINLIESPAQVIFGKSSKNNDGLSITLDEIGVALVLFSIPEFDAKDFSQFDVVLEKLPKNYRTNLVLVPKNSSEPVEIDLFQTTGNIQSNLLHNNRLWNGQISRLGLRISPQKDFGLSISPKNSVIIRFAELNNKGYMENYFSILNYWLAYKPWNYLTISHIQSHKLLPVYAKPVFFIILWLTICSLIFFVLTKKKFNLIAIIVAWFFLDLISINNMRINNLWVKEVYANDKKILPDNDLVNLSKKIKSLIDFDIQNPKEMLAHKIFIISDQKYQALRLVYHFLPYNVGFIGELIPYQWVKDGDYILSFSNLGNLITPQQNVKKHGGAKLNILEVDKGENYIFMKVVK